MVQKAAFKSWHYAAYREGNYQDIPEKALALLKELYPQTQPVKAEEKEKPKFQKRAVEVGEDK